MSGTSSPVEVLFASTISLNLDFILGMNGIRAFRGVTVNTPRDVRFGVKSACSAIATAVPDWVINDEDFTITYNAAETQWTVLWKWSNATEPPRLFNTTPEYKIHPEVRQDFDSELL